MFNIFIHLTVWAILNHIQNWLTEINVADVSNHAMTSSIRKVIYANIPKFVLKMFVNESKSKLYTWMSIEFSAIDFCSLQIKLHKLEIIKSKIIIENHQTCRVFTLCIAQRVYNEMNVLFFVSFIYSVSCCCCCRHHHRRRCRLCCLHVLYLPFLYIRFTGISFLVIII